MHRLFLGSPTQRSEIVAPIVIELRFVDRLARGKRARLGLKVERHLGHLGSVAGLARRPRGNWFALSCWKRAHLKQPRIERVVSKLDRAPFAQPAQMFVAQAKDPTVGL